jgi:hypothetical protein
MRARFNVRDFPFDVQLLPMVFKTRSEKKDKGSSDNEANHHSRAYVQLVHGGNIRKGKPIVLSGGMTIPSPHSFAHLSDWIEEYDVSQLIIANDYNESTWRNFVKNPLMKQEEFNEEIKELKDEDKYTIGIVIKRDYSAVNKNITMYVFLIQSLSVIAWGHPAHSLDGRLSIILDLILAMLAFKYTLADKLPTVPYQTKMDKYIYVCFIFLWCLGSFHFVLSTTFSEEDQGLKFVVKPLWMKLCSGVNYASSWCIGSDLFAECGENDALWSKVMLEIPGFRPWDWWNLFRKIMSDLPSNSVIDIFALVFTFMTQFLVLCHFIFSGQSRQGISLARWNKLAEQMLKKETVDIDEFTDLWYSSLGDAVKMSERENAERRRRRQGISPGFWK